MRTILIDALTGLRNAEDAFLDAGLEAGKLTHIDAGMMPATLIEADDLARQYSPDVAVARLTVDASMAIQCPDGECRRRSRFHQRN